MQPAPMAISVMATTDATLPSQQIRQAAHRWSRLVILLLTWLHHGVACRHQSCLRGTGHQTQHLPDAVAG
jgi:hypothetical protein